MRIRNALTLVAAAALAAGLAGCPSESCDLESPQVSALPASCTQVAGQPVTYPVRLCPTCNQFGATCVADLSAAATSGDIYLDTKVEACDDPGTCGGPACSINALTCTFTAPATPGTYTVIALDGLTGQPKESTLTVIAGGAEFCDLPAAGL
jgi:Tfp pilus assembly protein PilW